MATGLKVPSSQWSESSVDVLNRESEPAKSRNTPQSLFQIQASHKAENGANDGSARADQALHKSDEELTRIESTCRDRLVNDDMEKRDQRRKMGNMINYLWLDTWTPEALSSVLAGASLICLVVLLQRYQDKAIGELPSSIPINTLVAVISSIMKASLIMPVAEAISQSKWLWFNNQRPLLDFDNIDQASRGPWGSVLLITKLRSRHLVTFGAWITIAALAIDPFSQQIISYYPCQRAQVSAGSSASISRANTFTFEYRDTHTTANGEMVTSIYQALGSTSQQPSVSYQCPTSNCSFPSDPESGVTYQTLAVNVSCTDISHFAKRTSNVDGYEWTIRDKNASIGYRSESSPADISLRILSNPDGFPDPQHERGPFDSDMRPGPTYISNLTIFMLKRKGEPPEGADFELWNYYRDFTDLVEPLAIECCFVPTIQNIKGFVEKNVLHETVLNTRVIANSTDTDQEIIPLNPFTGHIAKKVLRNGVWELCNSSRVLGQDPSSVVGFNITDGFSMFFDDVAEDEDVANITVYYPRDCVWENSRLYQLRAYFKDLLDGQVFLTKTYRRETDTNLTDVWLSKLHANGTANFTTVSTWASNIASAMTTTIRNVGAGYDGAPRPASGVAYTTETCIAVQWVWGILPASLVPLAIIFLTLTARRTASRKKRGGPWKSSALAVLFHGLDESVIGGKDEELRSKSEMSNKAENVKVRLIEKETGWRLST